MRSEAINSAQDTISYPQADRSLSRPLKELIGIPSDEQLLTAARILGLVDAVQRRLDREAARRKTGDAA